MRNLEVRQATAKQFADVLHFVSLFDELKVMGTIIGSAIE